MSTFRLRVLTQERTVLSADAEYVQLPGVDGSFGILPGHAPVMGALAVGVLEFGPLHGKRRKIALSGGFLEMNNDQLTILANTAELAEEIDVVRAGEAKKRAERRLQEQQDDLDFTRARLALQKALLRLKVAEPE